MQSTNIKRFIVEFNELLKTYNVHLSIKEHKFNIEFNDVTCNENYRLETTADIDIKLFYTRCTVSNNTYIPVKLLMNLYTISMRYILSKRLSTENVNVIVKSAAENYTITDIFVDNNDKLTLVICTFVAGALELNNYTPIPINIADIADNNLLDLAKYMYTDVHDYRIETASLYNKNNFYKVLMFSSSYTYRKSRSRSPIGVYINGKKSKVTKQIAELCSIIDA